MVPDWAGSCFLKKRAVETWQPQSNAQASLDPQRLERVLALDSDELFAGVRLELKQIWGA